MSNKKVKNSKQRKTVEFWEKKNEAFRLFGKASTRPQQNFRSYLNAKRKLNLELEIRMNLKTKEIMSWVYDTSKLTVQSVGAIDFSKLFEQKNKWTIVDDEPGFEKLLDNLETTSEFTLDLEGNTDHSYTGQSIYQLVGFK
jgi:hypothetical protein